LQSVAGEDGGLGRWDVRVRLGDGHGRPMMMGEKGKEGEIEVVLLKTLSTGSSIG